jgi:AraC-like DNA-binding protein
MMSIELNVLSERARLSESQLARWHGLPICWVDASATVSAGRRVHERTVLAFLDAGHGEADFNFVTRRQHIDVAAGSLGLFVQGEVHSCRWRCSQARRILVDIDGAALRTQGLVVDERVLDGLRPELDFHDAEVARLLRGMVREVANGSPNGRLFAQSASAALVNRLLGRLSSTAGLATRERGRLTPAQLALVDAYVEHHLDGDIPLTALAAQLGLSVPHFARLFRQASGCSPHRYVVHKRVDRACELLRHSAMPLSSVAAAAGFSTQSHMSGTLKSHLGATPREIRAQAGRIHPDA